jgi:hypothetical protein
MIGEWLRACEYVFCSRWLRYNTLAPEPGREEKMEA